MAEQAARAAAALQSLRPSERGESVPKFLVMEMMAAAAERERNGGEVLHLEVGQPKTGAPAAALAAAHQALDRSASGADALGYTSEFGIPPLREAIAAHYQRAYGVAVPTARVMATTGSSGAFVVAFLAAFNSGDRVAIARPGYPCYSNILTAIGCEVVPLLVDDATNFQPTPALLDAAAAAGGPIRGVVVASPSNPCGTMLRPEELGALVAWCEGNGAWLVSDEIYHGLVYGDRRAATALEFGERSIVINSFSKRAGPATGHRATGLALPYFSMTGWRIGWCVLPTALIGAASALAQNLFISPPTVSQHAAAAAFGATEELEAHVARYRRNRAVLLEQLPRAGFRRCAAPDGAFYVYAEVAHLTGDSMALAKRILATTGVAVTPGIDFDKQARTGVKGVPRGHLWLRFSYCGATEAVEEAARRLVEGKWKPEGADAAGA